MCPIFLSKGSALPFVDCFFDETVSLSYQSDPCATSSSALYCAHRVVVIHLVPSGKIKSMATAGSSSVEALFAAFASDVVSVKDTDESAFLSGGVSRVAADLRGEGGEGEGPTDCADRPVTSTTMGATVVAPSPSYCRRRSNRSSPTSCPPPGSLRRAIRLASACPARRFTTSTFVPEKVNTPSNDLCRHRHPACTTQRVARKSWKMTPNLPCTPQSQHHQLRRGRR